MITNRTAQVVISDDGQRFVVVTDKNAQLWSIPDGKPIGSSMTHETTVAGAALSPEGRRLAVFGGNSVSLWDIPSGRRVCEPMRHPLTVSLS